MKTLNIEMTVRYMDAKSIIVTSQAGLPEIEMGDGVVGTEGNHIVSDAAARTATPVAPGSFRN